MKFSGVFLLVFVLLYEPFSASFAQTNTRCVQEEYDKIRYMVDPRIELLSVVQLLCDDYIGFNGKAIMSQVESTYKQQALEYFAEYKEHQAVKLVGEMSKNGFWYGHPPRAVLCLSAFPELKTRFPLDNLALTLAGGELKLQEFYDALHSFAHESNFTVFFRSHEESYRRMIKTYFPDKRRNYPRDLEQFFGSSLEEYNLILSPLFHSGGYGERIETGDNQFSTYVIVGPAGLTEDGLPDFGYKQHRLFWHEFSHPHVNHITESHIEELLTPCTALQTIKKEDVEQYGIAWEVHIADWVSEHVVRGTEVCMTRKYVGEQEVDGLIDLHKKRGFPYVREIAEALQRYDDSRDKYAQLRDFYPEIVKAFEQIAESR